VVAPETQAYERFALRMADEAAGFLTAAGPRESPRASMTQLFRYIGGWSRFRRGAPAKTGPTLRAQREYSLDADIDGKLDRQPARFEIALPASDRRRESRISERHARQVELNRDIAAGCLAHRPVQPDDARHIQLSLSDYTRPGRLVNRLD
jgi:hypothetical protein